MHRIHSAELAEPGPDDRFPYGVFILRVPSCGIFSPLTRK